MDMGITKGVEVYVRKVAPLGDPIEVTVRGYELSLRKLDAEMITPPEIYCRSVGSILNKAKNGKFPLNFSYNLVKHFDGPNDGLVGEQSFRWGEDYILVTTKSKRGISHGDMIDLNRENFEGFDVPVPIGYEEILSTHYGDWRQLPPIEKRGTWHNSETMDPDISYTELSKILRKEDK